MPTGQAHSALPDIPQIQQLWDELAAFPASRIDDALSHLMAWFQRHLDVDDVFWLGSQLMLEEEIATNDPLRGRRLRARRQLKTADEEYHKPVASYYSSEHYGKLTAAYRAGKHGLETNVHVGETQQNFVAGAGRFRAYRRAQKWWASSFTINFSPMPFVSKGPTRVSAMNLSISLRLLFSGGAALYEWLFHES